MTARSAHLQPFRTLALITALLLFFLSILPYGSAHGGTPVDSREGDIVLGPRGLFHQFGFQMGPGDILHMGYQVLNPQTQAVDFSVHRHNATGYLEILNVTQTYLQLDRPVPEAGVYMPQWLNLVSSNVTLHYSVYYVRGPSTLDLIEEILAAGIPAALLGLFAFSYFRNKRRERLGPEGGVKKEEQPEGEKGAGPKGPV